MHQGPRRSPFKTYLVPILLSIGFVIVSPMGLLVIFLSGDSCCGENTSGTMIGVTLVFVVLGALVAALLSLAVKASVKRSSPDFSVLVATVITAGPATLIYVGFVTFVVLTAF